MMGSFGSFVTHGEILWRMKAAGIDPLRDLQKHGDSCTSIPDRHRFSSSVPGNPDVSHCGVRFSRDPSLTPKQTSSSLKALELGFQYRGRSRYPATSSSPIFGKSATPTEHAHLVRQP